MEKELFKDVRKDPGKVLSEIASKGILKEIGIPTTEIKLAFSLEEAVFAARDVGFPVVLKISSPDISHKSDAGGVKLGLKNAEEVAQAYREILTSIKQQFPKAQVDSVAVQNMARPGTEVIMGMTTDPQFGAVMMFGLGGIWTEVLKDVTFRLAPLTHCDAREMITGIKGYALLKGYRNLEPANISMLEDMLLKLSGFVCEHSEIKEMDLNPLLAYQDGVLAVDARIVINNRGENLK